MSEILPGKLWLGSERDANDPAFLAAHGIDRILTVADNATPLPLAHNARYPVPETADGAAFLGGQFAALSADIDASEARVLVHCVAGVNRLSTAVVAHVMLHTQCSLVDAFRLVKQRRPKICPSELFVAQLVALERGLFGGRGSTSAVAHEARGQLLYG